MEGSGVLMAGIEGKIQWFIRVPIFKNRVILKQLGIAIGIPFGVLILIILIASGQSIYALYALSIIGALLFFTWLFIMVVYGGKYDVEFVLDSKGVLCRTQAKQAKKNRFVNGLTAVLGFLSGKPTIAGAVILAQSRQKAFIPWKRVTRVKYRPCQRTILIKSGWLESITLFCTEENYFIIQQAVINSL